MTLKNVKTILFAFLLVAMILPFSSMDFAEAKSDKIGKTTIKTEKKQNTMMDNAVKKLEKLEMKLDKANNAKQRQQIHDQMDRVKEHTLNQLQKVDAQRQAKYALHVEKLSNNVFDNSKSGSDKRLVPFTDIGYRTTDDALVIGIEPQVVTTQNMQNYASIIRGIVGDDVDIVLEKGSIWKSGDCSSRTSNCNEIEGGVKMQVTGHGACTVGIKATYDSKTGFVSAGHCADGNEGDDVGQDTISNVVGTVHKEVFDAGSSYEYCDCSFIETDSAIAEEIYGVSASYYPNHTYTVSDNDWVKISGMVSGITIGYVTDWSGTAYLSATQTTLQHVAIATYYSTDGDSGAPMMQAYESDPGFTGINVAFTTDHSKSAFVKHDKFTSAFSGLQWGF